MKNGDKIITNKFLMQYCIRPPHILPVLDKTLDLRSVSSYQIVGVDHKKHQDL